MRIVVTSADPCFLNGIKFFELTTSHLCHNKMIFYDQENDHTEGRPGGV
jgi:hypothetical protein